MSHSNEDNACVGPFFYIGGKLYAYKESLEDHQEDGRFINASLSHFEYFITLPIEGDYGNYPRGRVLYDRNRKKFLVYIDKSLDKESSKQLILNAYNLKAERALFRHDAHYTHDGL